MKAKVADRGQATIPKVLRDRLGIRPGTILEFKEDHGKLVAVKAVTMDTIINSMAPLDVVGEPMISCRSCGAIRDYCN